MFEASAEDYDFQLSTIDNCLPKKAVQTGLL